MMTNNHPVGDCVRGPKPRMRFVPPDPTEPVGPIGPIVPIGGGIIETIIKWLLGGGGVIRDPHPEPGPPEIPGPWRRPGYPRPGPDEWVIRRSATAGVPGE